MLCLDCKYCMYNREINNYECLNSDCEFYDEIVWENDFCWIMKLKV